MATPAPAMGCTMSTASSPRADESRSTPSPKRQKISPVTVSQVRVQPQPCISTLSADKPKQRGGRVQPLSRRATLNADKRAIVVDWLMELQRKLRIHPESLFLAVSILDRVNLHPSRLDIHDVASQTKREIVVKNARKKNRRSSLCAMPPLASLWPQSTIDRRNRRAACITNIIFST